MSMLALVGASCNHVEKAKEAMGEATEVFNLAAAKESVATNNAAFAKALEIGRAHV